MTAFGILEHALIMLVDYEYSSAVGCHRGLYFHMVPTHCAAQFPMVSDFRETPTNKRAHRFSCETDPIR